MYRCVICHFSVELDDTVITGSFGRTVCLRCYAHECGTEKPMPKLLRRWVLEVLSAIEGNSYGQNFAW